MIERDPVTGEQILRGKYVMSANLLSVETAADEMKAVASMSARVQDPILHYQLAWQPGERPTEDQWNAAAVKSIEALGFAEHQYIVVAHDDRAHFHVHVMINRVHPETGKAWNPYGSQLTLHRVARELEHEFGWKESPGLYRWDSEKGTAVRNTRDEMRRASEQYRSGRTAGPELPSGPAGKLEHYNDRESLESYAKGAPGRALRQFLARDDATWEGVHGLLREHGLVLEQSEKGGFAVRTINGDLRVKASSVFRANFSGKANRDALAARLGEWVPAKPSAAQTTPLRQYTPEPKRDPAERAERRAERAAARKSLNEDYKRYREKTRTDSAAATTAARERRAAFEAQFREEKKAIRAMSVSWVVKRAMLSAANAQAVGERHRLRAELLQSRSAGAALDFKQWVSVRAAGGDQRAAAQLRGWRYQDQRNLARAAAERPDRSLSPATLQAEDYWSELAISRLKQLRDEQALSGKIQSLQWKIDRRTGDVCYILNHRIAFVDRGKDVAVSERDETTTLLAIEMAVSKFGPILNVNGEEDWQAQVVEVAAKHRVNVRFADERLQSAFESLSPDYFNPYRQLAAQYRELVPRLGQGAAGGVVHLSRDEAQTFFKALFGTQDDVLSSMERITEPGTSATHGLLGQAQITIGKSGDSTQFSYSLAFNNPEAAAELLKRVLSAAERTEQSAKSYRPSPFTRRPISRSPDRER